MPPVDTFTRLARLIRVLDGDTYELDVDLGFRIHARLMIRVRGLWAPELHEPGGPEMRDLAETALKGAQQLTITSYKDRQSFARWIADVYVDGVLMGDRLTERPDVEVVP